MRASRDNRTKSRRGEPWSVAELGRLGKTPDSVLARRSRRTIKEVVAMREQLRIALETGPRRWSMKEIGLLGRMNDYELGRRLRRAHHQVSRHRRALGIPPFKPRGKFRYWKSAEIKLMGTMPDAELAAKLRCTRIAVQVQRIRHRIPTFNTKHFWAPDHFALLGKVPDEELAQLTGRSVSAVQSMRLKYTPIRLPRRTPAKLAQPKRVWTEQEKEIFRQCGNQEAAARLGCSLRAARRARKELGMLRRLPGRHWTPEEEALLGTEPDAVLAQRLHRTRVAVLSRRLSLNRASVSPRAPEWSPDENRLLGTVPDAEAAQQLNRTLAAVKVQRAKLRIPPLREEGRARRWSAAEDALIGTTRDEDLALKLNRTELSVKQRRRRLQMALSSRAAADGRPRKTRYWEP